MHVSQATLTCSLGTERDRGGRAHAMLPRRGSSAQERVASPGHPVRATPRCYHSGPSWNSEESPPAPSTTTSLLGELVEVNMRNRSWFPALGARLVGYYVCPCTRNTIAIQGFSERTTHPRHHQTERRCRIANLNFSAVNGRTVRRRDVDHGAPKPPGGKQQIELHYLTNGLPKRGTRALRRVGARLDRTVVQRNVGNRQRFPLT